MSNEITSKNWTGEFFLPDSREQRFAGELEYTSEGSLRLVYRVVGSEPIFTNGTLHGVLSSGERCTLIGPFHSTQTESSIGGHLASFGGIVVFDVLLVGDFVEKDDGYKDVSFSLTNLEEFFYPTGFKNTVRFSEEPICSASAPFGNVKVCYSAIFNNLHDIRAHIYSGNSEASAELERAFERVCALYPDAMFSVKKDISCRVVFQLFSDSTVSKIFEWINDISNLFALLMYAPIFPTDIAIRETNGQKTTLRAFKTSYLDAKTVQSATRERFHWHLPIREPLVPLERIIERWLPIARDNISIVSTVQNGGGIYSERAIHALIVLHATQLESIGYNANHKKDKYEFPLDAYGGDTICSQLISIFGKKNICEVAVALSELRGEMTHIGRPKRWLKRLPISKIIDIEHCLQLVIIGHLLSIIEVPVDAIREYQHRYIGAS